LVTKEWSQQRRELLPREVDEDAEWQDGFTGEHADEDAEVDEERATSDLPAKAMQWIVTYRKMEYENRNNILSDDDGDGEWCERCESFVCHNANNKTTVKAEVDWVFVDKPIYDPGRKKYAIVLYNWIVTTGKGYRRISDDDDHPCIKKAVREMFPFDALEVNGVPLVQDEDSE
jgi:hypothetical protein